MVGGSKEPKRSPLCKMKRERAELLDAVAEESRAGRCFGGSSVFRGKAGLGCKGVWRQTRQGEGEY